MSRCRRSRSRAASTRMRSAPRVGATDPPSPSLPHALRRRCSSRHVGFGVPGAPCCNPIAARSRPARARQPRPRQCCRASSTVVSELPRALGRITRRRPTSAAAPQRRGPAGTQAMVRGACTTRAGCSRRARAWRRARASGQHFARVQNLRRTSSTPSCLALIRTLARAPAPKVEASRARQIALRGQWWACWHGVA